MPIDFQPIAEAPRKRIDFTPIDFEPLEKRSDTERRELNVDLREQMRQIDAERPSGVALS